jgi:SPOR domain
MLRWVIWLLVLGNVGYFAWSQGYLDTLGLKPAEQREPQRLTQQVRPEALRLLNGPKADAAQPTSAAPLPTSEAVAPDASAPSVGAPVDATVAVPAPTESTPGAVAPVAVPVEAQATPQTAGSGPRACWQVGGFTAAQAELLRAELALLGLPATGFSFTEVRSGGRWIVYMGRYDNQQQLDRKKDELRALGVTYREITAPGLAPGLALGTFSTEAAAQQARQKAERDGIRTAKVAQERAESVSTNLRLPSINEAQRTAVDGLGEAMAGKRLQRCS